MRGKAPALPTREAMLPPQQQLIQRVRLTILLAEMDDELHQPFGAYRHRLKHPSAKSASVRMCERLLRGCAVVGEAARVTAALPSRAVALAQGRGGGLRLPEGALGSVSTLALPSRE